MVLQYGIGNTFASVSNWIAPGGNFNWASPITGMANDIVLDGNSAANRVANLGGDISLDWSAESTLWIRWIENNDPSYDHALAIDNLTFSVVGTMNDTGSADIPEPTTLALLGIGIAGLGAAAESSIIERELKGVGWVVIGNATDGGLRLV